MYGRVDNVSVWRPAYLLTLCVVVLLTWGCKRSENYDSAECELGEVSQRPCGTLNQGIQMMICQEYQWVEDGECLDDSKCFGDNERAKDCGINWRGQQWQQCVAGQWTDEGMCYDGDACIDGTEKFGVCGARNQGRITLVCRSGQWIQKSLQCDENVTCTSGQSDTVACGINWSGSIDLVCEHGSWVAQGECTDADVCENNETTTRSCGDRDLGIVELVCLQGQWAPPRNAQCVRPTVCVSNDENYREDNCEWNNRGVTRQYCEDGRWGEWGECDDPDECRDTTDEVPWECGADRTGYAIASCTDGRIDAPCLQLAADLYAGAGGFRVVLTNMPRWFFDVPPVILATGPNHTRQLGLGHGEKTATNTHADRLVSTAIPVPSRAPTDTATLGNISGASRDHECVVAAGELYCWGNNASGELARDPLQLAMSDTPERIIVGTPTTLIESVALGDGFTCALTSEREVYCWGLNDQSQLGGAHEEATHHAQRVNIEHVIAIAAGDAHVCVIVSAENDAMTDGLYCWGRNRESQAGASVEDEFTEPAFHDAFDQIEFTPPVWTENIITGTIRQTVRFVDVLAAANHTIAFVQSVWEHIDDLTGEILRDDAVTHAAAIGQNSEGVIGPDFVNGNIDAPIVLATWNHSYSTTHSTRMYVSRTMTCMPTVQENQDAFLCTGDNTYGQIDPRVETPFYGFTTVVGMQDHRAVRKFALIEDAICLLSAFDHHVYCRGNNDRGQLGNGGMPMSASFEPIWHYNP